MPTLMLNELKALSRKFPGVLANADTPTELIVTNQIDLGVDDVLTPHTNNWLQYPPLQVEYLLRTVSEHIENCIELRDQAYDLEIRAIQELLDLDLQSQSIKITKQQIALDLANQPKLLGNTIDTKVAADKVSGSDSQYWTESYRLQLAQIELQEKNIKIRYENIQREGSGQNFLARYKKIVEIFNIEMKEAYLRAKSAAAGLKSVYVLDKPVPALSGSGYLDLMRAWIRQVLFDFERRLYPRRETVIGLTLGGKDTELPLILKKTEFDAGITARTISFPLTADHFKKFGVELKNIRLRGITAVIGSTTALEGNSNLWRFQIDCPKQIVAGDVGLNWEYSPSVLLPSVGALPTKAPSDDALSLPSLHNATPIGNWVIRFEPHDFFRGEPTSPTSIASVTLFFNVTYDV